MFINDQQHHHRKDGYQTTSNDRNHRTRIQPNSSGNDNFSNLHSPRNHHNHQHNLQMPQLDAVIIRNLTYEAGRGSGKRTILNKINLTVPEGSIYGLLGPSGCGKTTMLRCVVGRIRARSGAVLVFGFRPGDGFSEVPGRDVGYMPQEISIYEDFTIQETLEYFGKINRMHSSDIKKRVQFLLKFLDLPSKKRLVVNLSGGQKRRVSLAAALVHSPPLLILDEPTVGVDPLLRQSIWKHLVTLTQTERISVIITTHYIEEARQANVVGLMRHGKILAENSPDELMRIHSLTNLEDVFLKLCMTDSSRRAASLAGTTNHDFTGDDRAKIKSDEMFSNYERELTKRASARVLDKGLEYTHRWNSLDKTKSQHRWERVVSPATSSSRVSSDWQDTHNHKHTENNFRYDKKAVVQLETSVYTRQTQTSSLSSSDEVKHDDDDDDGQSNRKMRDRKSTQNQASERATTTTTTAISGVNRHQLNQVVAGYANEAVEDFSLEDQDNHHDDRNDRRVKLEEDFNLPRQRHDNITRINLKLNRHNPPANNQQQLSLRPSELEPDPLSLSSSIDQYSDDYVAVQAIKWAARRNKALSLVNLKLPRNISPPSNINSANKSIVPRRYQQTYSKDGGAMLQWWKTLMAVTWKNYIRLRRNPPVLVFQFMLPAIQVILFCLCIGGEPFDVPVAIVNDEVVPKASLQFLNGLNRKIIRQIKYDNLTSALDAVKKGTVWGVIHIPDKYSQNLQARLILGEEVNNETISNGTIKVYPDLTNLHLAMALETSFRETFINFARDSLEEMGYDRSLADLPIQVGKPVYGSMRKDGYLEFMAPGVVISISYVMATGLTALAFILERRDGLLERSLVSGVQTSQILLAHAINQVVVMTLQIFLVLACTFFIFEIPSRGPFFWVVLLILLQGCTGMGFGLLVSAICKEENTAVMMVVGTFYTNLILAGIIWPIEAMPHWLRPVSYAQPQTLPTDTLRHILSRGWGIGETGVLIGFAVTIGWLVIFLLAAGMIFKYSR